MRSKSKGQRGSVTQGTSLFTHLARTPFVGAGPFRGGVRRMTLGSVRRSLLFSFLCDLLYPTMTSLRRHRLAHLLSSLICDLAGA